MSPTQYPDINNLLQIILSKIQSVLGGKLIGLYLYGSLVTGDFDQNISDIDLVAALESDLTDEEFKALEKMHQDFANEHTEWNDRIEVQYMPKSALKTFKTEESEIAVISPGEPFHKRVVGKHWLMNWYIVRENGVTLFGADPKIIIEPISKEEFIEAVKSHTSSWSEWVKDMHTKGAQGYAILTLCRAYYAVKNGEQVSKKQAAQWTIEQLPQWSSLIKEALEWYKNRENKKIDGKETYSKTAEFVNFIRDLIIK
ncbi:MAG: aminoglycoside adenylyltransferase domain-containing protein [Microgenomates group bacterium]|jgi:predicted nucleotidyltransferase